MLAILLLVILDLAQREHLLTAWPILALNLCEFEHFGDLLRCTTLDRDELTRFCLLTVATSAASLLPLLDAWLAIDGCLANIAEDGLLGLRHDDFLADDAVSIRKEAKFVQLFAIAEPVFGDQAGSRGLRRQINGRLSK